MKLKTNGKLENYEVFHINRVVNGDIKTVKKIYKVQQGNVCRNIIEEENTIYEVE